MIKDIKDYEGYYTISYDAVITNVKTGHVLKYRLDLDGYLIVDLYRDGVKRTHRVHRLVAEAFVPNPNPLLYNIVLHKDNNKLNIHPSNLTWGTVQMNNIQAVQDGLRNFASIPGVAKEYVIRYPNGNNATPFIFYKMSTIVDLIGYGTDNTGYSMLRRHTKIGKNSSYAGCYVERYIEE